MHSSRMLYHPGEVSVQGGVSVYGGISVMETPSLRYSNVRTVGILLECILVHIIIYEMRFRIKKNRLHVPE